MADGHWMGFGFGGGLMWIIWILLILAAVWGIKVAVSSGGEANRPTSRQESALEILKARFARGEISAEEYKRMRHELEN